MCGTPGTVFSWFGAIFINISFGFLIAWGVTTQWIVGFILSFIYSCVLFLISYKLSKHAVVVEISTMSDDSAVRSDSDNVNNNGEGIEQMTPPTEEQMATMTDTSANDSAKQGLRTLVILLYTLAVISVGVTGLIIPMNVFYCDYGNYGYYNNDYIWNTNMSSFSNDVQNWYNDTQNGQITDSNSANFAILPSNGVLAFTGKDTTSSSYDDFVYSYDGTSMTKLSNFKNPSSFVVTTDNSSICMSGYYYSNDDTDNNKHEDDYINVESSSTIACYDGINLRFVTNYDNISKENHNYKDFYGPSHLYPSTNHTIWFVAISQNYYAYNSPPVFSLNDQTMALTLHSTLMKQSNDGKDIIMDTPSSKCDIYKIRRYRALISIFSSILPTFITAIIVTRKIDFIPTMHIIIYISITAFIVSLILSIQPNFEYMDLVLKYWSCVTSGIWMLYMIITLGILSSRKKQNDNKSFVWNINFTAILFFFAMSWSLGIPVPFYDTWWRWVLINFIVYIPYIFFGTAIENILLVIFGAIGIFNDVWRFSNALAKYIDPGFQIIIQVMLFAVIGILVGFLGWKINQYQQQVQAFVRLWIDRNLGFLIERRNNDDDNDGGGDEVLETNNVLQDSYSSDENDGAHAAAAIL